MNVGPERVSRIGRGFMLAWDLLLLAALFGVWAGREPFPGGNLGATAAISGIFVLWTWYWVRLRRRDWWQGAVVAGFSLLAIVVVVGLPLAPGTSIVIFACVILGAGLPARYGLPAAVGAALLAFGEDLTKGYPSIAASLAFNNVLVALLAVGGRVFVTSYFDLHAAREEIARLAVADERLRFSRDLHDLLGHSLAVIVLKGEVAARQLPEASGPRRELGQMVAVARQALEQVRDAVAGYRLPSLDQELGNARRALVSAGVETGFENRAGRLPQTTDVVLGWAVREGATNVIRHSQARRCRIKVWSEGGTAHLEMENDGVRADDLNLGNGLRGLEERTKLLGGSIHYEAAAGSFRLRVAVPAGERSTLQPA